MRNDTLYKIYDRALACLIGFVSIGTVAGAMGLQSVNPRLDRSPAVIQAAYTREGTSEPYIGHKAEWIQWCQTRDGAPLDHYILDEYECTEIQGLWASRTPDIRLTKRGY